MKCTHCGYDDGGSGEVDFRLDYVGGSGMESIGPLCQDRTACWARYDIQQGLNNTPAIREVLGKREREKVTA